MWVVIRSGENGQLDRNAECLGAFYDYDEAFDTLDAGILAKAAEYGLSEEDCGSNYDDGTGFSGIDRTPTFLFQIFEA